MNLIANLRRRWRAHDEKLAEHAYLEHHEPEFGAVEVPLEPSPYGPVGPTTAAEQEGEAVISDGVRVEDELEHEAPE